MTLESDAEREVRELHEFFESWFRGELDADEFEHPRESLAAEFRMVPPEGNETARDPVLDSIEAGYDSAPSERAADEESPFVIEVHDVRTLRTLDDHCQMTYEEWQRRDGEWAGRRSTALFRREESAPNGVVWVDLHETWIEGRDRPE